MIDYLEKYIKYKTKYIALQNSISGGAYIDYNNDKCKQPEMCRGKCRGMCRGKCQECNNDKCICNQQKMFRGKCRKCNNDKCICNKSI